MLYFSFGGTGFEKAEIYKDIKIQSAITQPDTLRWGNN